MKKAISLTSIGLCLLLFLSVLTLPVHAYSYTLETCPLHLKLVLIQRECLQII